MVIERLGVGQHKGGETLVYMGQGHVHGTRGDLLSTLSVV